MNNRETSYIGLFQHQFENGTVIRGIEIPMLQRDYAQGRHDKRTTDIRSNFLSALVSAITTDEKLSLDFIYGDVKSGVLVPLDGQQRLTTLFLLHWFVGSESGNLTGKEPWLSLTYETRASARRFCKLLADNTPKLATNTPSEWLKDQPWFLQSWEGDPTIQSMLTVLDEIQKRLEGFDINLAWTRLTDTDLASITFHVLPMQEVDFGKDIYIKMNSRGKPLTEFELFKARFERMLDLSANPRAKDFARRIDHEWMELFWRPDRSAYDIDSAIVRYLRYLTDIATWLSGSTTDPNENLERAGLRIFGTSHGDAAAGNVDLIFSGLDTWAGVDLATWFAEHFVSWLEDGDSFSGQPVPLRLFSATNLDDCNLFNACCQAYGANEARKFGMPEALLLFAVLVHRWRQTPDVDRRLRIIRNLIVGSSSELRAERMPFLIADVQRIIQSGDLNELSGFNDRVQGADEREKLEFLERNPGLENAVFALEDHPLLRGCLAAFDLDAETFERRAAAFTDLFSDESRLQLITAALLAAGDYALRIRGRYYFGSARPHNRQPWRDVFTTQARQDQGMGRVRHSLGLLLDHVAQRGEMPLDAALKAYVATYLTQCEHDRQLDWRYYFVKYDAMRQGVSGMYVPNGSQLGYSVCMLHRKQMNSNYHDPYLDAVRALSKSLRDKRFDTFTGYESNPRRMRLECSGIDIESIAGGWHLRIPEMIENRSFLEGIFQSQGVLYQDNGVWLLPVEQVANASLPDGSKIDSVDRIQLAANLLDILVEAGY